MTGGFTMNNNHYCDVPDLPLNNRNLNELITIVANEVGISEKELEEQLMKVKDLRYRGNLNYWKVLDIATVLKHNKSIS